MVLLAKLFNDYINQENKNLREKSIQLQASKNNGDKLTLKSTSISPDKMKNNIINLSIGMIILYCLCGGVAAYFSWNHNSKIGWTTGYKIPFAVFAFFCPMEYITIYFTYKSDLLKYMERTKTEFVEVIAPPAVASVSK
jgi:hypothetical protein